MNLLRALFANRRKRTEAEIAEDRRYGLISRGQAASQKKDAAVDELLHTISMPPAEAEQFRRSLGIAHDSPWTTVEFVSFAEGCDYRKPAGKDGIASVCTHSGHDAASTGIASCAKALCPRGRK